jgi:hypothetical protein
MFISDELFFITTDSRGVIAVKHQKIFNPLDKRRLQNMTDAKLKSLCINANIDMIDSIQKETMVSELIEYYNSNRWNPFNINPEGRNNFFKALSHFLVVVSLWILQAVNVLLFVLWPVVMVMRLPIILLVMIFLSSTKLIFFKEPWNMVVYMWTLDKSKLKGVEDNEIDMELLHTCKMVEFVVELGAQLILQFVNTVVLNHRGSSAYTLSLIGCFLDLAFCAYRYAYHFLWLRKTLSGLKIYDDPKNEIKSIEERILMIRERDNNFQSLEMTESPSLLRTLGTFGIFEGKISLSVSELDARIEKEVDARLDSRLEAEVESRVESRLGSRLEAEVESRVESRLGTRIKELEDKNKELEDYKHRLADLEARITNETSTVSYGEVSNPLL